MSSEEIENLSIELDKCLQKLKLNCNSENEKVATISGVLEILKELSLDDFSDKDYSQEKFFEASRRLKIVAHNIIDVHNKINDIKQKLTDMHHKLYMKGDYFGF